ncbi:MAG: flagellar basal body P-ring formation chaperone FlgA [Gammaproteobacteria bacterium]|nr:flagellar basal body P-ring formation chaperone FlgA [Gammaproteobacteria bacterium]
MNIGSVKLSRYAIYSAFLLNIAIISTSYADPTTQSHDKQSLHNHQDIKETARQFLDANINKSQFSRIKITMGQLDSRLKLSKCPLPLTATLAPGSEFAGKTTVHLRCSTNNPWTVYISARINLFGKVIQTASPLTKGHIIRKGDLHAVEEDLSRIKYGYFTSKEHLIGKQLKRRLPQNRIVKANYVKAPTLVKRGELVSIVAENTGYSVKMTGTAMNNGAKGERIQVKNSSSKRIVEGIIKEAGVVSIN